MPCSHCSAPKVLARGLCQPCYHRLRRNGTVARKYVVRQDQCSVDGCGRRTFARNLCAVHYRKTEHPTKTTWKLLRSRWPGQYPQEWDSFEAFIAAVGPRPSRRHQLRRRDYSKPITKENVHWLEGIPGGRNGSMSAEQRAVYAREWKLRRTYGLTSEEYDARLARQKGVCAICRQPEKHTFRNGNLKSLSVDHDHETGAIRGLLCVDCNRGLAEFGDSPERLRTAANYLDNSRA